MEYAGFLVGKLVAAILEPRSFADFNRRFVIELNPYF
jgi:hypothetical protein